MPDNTVFYAADWWPPSDESDDGPLGLVIEVDRADEDEVAVYVRGLSGHDDAGSIYLTTDIAVKLALALREAATELWSPPA